MATNAAGGGGGGPADFIGALISLVSKSDIRYQGLLAQIDPVKATIALEQVRSYGTEGRLASQGKPQDEIPPSNNTYEFVTFRAADVKDLRIDDPHPPKQQQQPQQDFVDPAILGTSPPNTRFGGGVPPPGPYGPPPGQWGPPPPHPAAYGGYGPGPFMGPPPPHFGGPGGPQMQRPPQPQPASQQNTPAQAPAAPAAPAAAVSSPSKPAATKTKAATSAQKTNGALEDASKPAQVDSDKRKAADKAAADQVVADLAKLNVGDQKPKGETAGAATAGTTSSQPPKSSAARSPVVNASLPARPAAPRGTSGGIPGSANRAPRGPPASVFDNGTSRNGAGHIDVPSSDFDFESANAKFAKEKAEAEKGGNDDVLEAIPPPKEEGKSFYDKSSFFDNISSEVRERHDRVTSPRQERGGITTGFDSEGRGGGSGGFGGDGAARGGRGGGRGGGRQARFEEDRKNLDTFGEVGSSRGGGRGGRGGRGRGRGRGRGGPRGGGGGARMDA
ncbi:hypothetical protein BCV69DRAFT_282803 [Microstroma glucosiphilum]|uniref:DFDF domain-containing protein n=1 Tax=Pseudomicrostroma glucosiphilum TaxID=1684307 RepID=A0A316U6X8_9BASI|nr:hypothetical protein BCV69DRAFT_282803 [Pseudomicrostroma glucosiphilum]PWN20594.1 hypothetical protein BCV69DRAFT_282803 [Pseudomicrostroma glucosiphilum]